MVRDGELAEIRRNAVNARPDRVQSASISRPSRVHLASTQNAQASEKQQNHNAFVNTELELEAEIEPPRAPPARGGAKTKQNSRRREKEDGWTQLATARAAKKENN
jgi:hypothetical protein